MSKITSPMMLDTTGQAISTSMEELVTAQKKMNSFLYVLASDKLGTTSVDMQRVKRLVQNEEIQNFFKIGDRFNMKWTNTSGTELDKPFHIAHFGTAELTDGVTSPAMFLQSHWCTDDAVQFSARRALFAVTAEEFPNGVPAGVYKVSCAEDITSEFSKDRTFLFTTSQVIPVGGSISINERSESGVWSCYFTTWASDGIAKIEEGLKAVVDGDEPEGTIDLGSFKAVTRNGNLNCWREAAYGCNRWDISAYRQYLNSDAVAGKWWTKQDKWDLRPNQYNTVNGFMKGLPEEFLEVVKPVKVKTYLNTCTEDGSAVETWDRFFLPSLHQMHINAQVADEGETWDYWKQVFQSETPLPLNTVNPLLLQYKGPSATASNSCFFRSADRRYAHWVWAVNTSGLVDNYSTINGFYGAPACVIGG